MNTDGINSNNDITLSGDSDAYFDSLICNTITSKNVIVPRINTALIPYLDASINLTTFVQNMNFSDNNRNFVMNSDDNAFGELLNFDCSNNEFYLYPDIMHITPVSTLDISSPNISFTDSNVTFAYSNINLYPFVTTITINNFGFSTPAQALNNFSTIASPYSAITGWTITLVSGTAPSIFVGKGFTALVNLYDYAFPEYPLFTQYVSFQAPSIYQMSFTQSLTFATTGNYILTFYIWGEYNRYSPTNNISVSCGNNSINNFPAVEGAWKKVIMKFQITTAGSNTLTILVNNTSGTDSGISFSGVQIVDESGLLVYDGGNTNNQLITPKGIYSSGFINNQGNILNYGNFINYGPLNVLAPYSSGTLVIGSSLYGTTNADSGRYSTLIGSQVVANGGYTPVNLDSCVFIGYGAGEQAINVSRNHGIGYQSGRWAISNNCGDNVGYGYQSNYALGYAGGSNNYGNVSIGNFTLSGAYTSNNYLNTTIGHSSLSGVDFSNSKSCNTVCGANSLQVLASGFNSSLGYNNANGITNTASNGNVFIGTNVCNTQSVNTNVLQNCTFLSSNSDVSVAGNYLRSTCIGYNSRITASDQIILGTSLQTTYAMGGLAIANKINLATNQTLTGATITLSFSTAENILLTDATTATINLPTPTIDNVGCKFILNRSATTSVTQITINAPSGQTIGYYDPYGTFNTVTPFYMFKAESHISLLCVGTTGTTWVVINTTMAVGAIKSKISTSPPVTTDAHGISFSRITAGAIDYYDHFSDPTNLSYKPSTTTLTASNISCDSATVTTTFKANSTFIIGNIHRPYEVASIAGSATALPGAPTALYGNYFWSASTTASTNTVIVLPTITLAMIGCELSFRRITSFSTNTLIIKTPALGATIMNRNSTTTTAANTNYTLIDTTATITGNYARIVAYTTSQWIVMF